MCSCSCCSLQILWRNFHHLVRCDVAQLCSDAVWNAHTHTRISWQDEQCTQYGAGFYCNSPCRVVVPSISILYFISDVPHHHFIFSSIVASIVFAAKNVARSSSQCKRQYRILRWTVAIDSAARVYYMNDRQHWMLRCVVVIYRCTRHVVGNIAYLCSVQDIICIVISS